MKAIFFACMSAVMVGNFYGSSSTSISANSISSMNKKAVDTPLVQVAILLDVSSSMDGLIEQAKTQLWSMVETLGKSYCNGEKPKIQIALYEYGRSNGDAANNYIKQISPFTTDLDLLSAKLFQLNTNGGEEYCGAVMVKSLQELDWNKSPDFYKVIFIAGNESFRQGNVSVIEACRLAKQKGVIINTIYCGEKNTGISEFWKMDDCSNGSYSNINQNAQEEYIAAPQDSMIMVLNYKLNDSYVTYNNEGGSRAAMQRSMDDENAKLSKKNGINRASVKASGNYRNSNWDLVDAYRADSTVVSRVEKQYLPAEVKDKSEAEVKKYVKQKEAERGAIQQQMNNLVTERNKYIAEARKEKERNRGQQTLDNAIQATIKSQAEKFHFVFEQ